MKPWAGVLSGTEVSQIHQAALRILERIGMRFPSPDAHRLLVDAGCPPPDGDTVHIPPAVVEKALETAPKRANVVLYGRDPVHDLRFGDQGPALACMTMAVGVIDWETGDRRPATNADLALLTRMADRLPNISVNGGLVTPQDVPGAVNDWYTWATTLKHTTKHITGGVYEARGVRDAVEMACLACGSADEFAKRPFISGWVLSLPPLGVDAPSLKALMELARLRVPAIISSGPILGTTSPVTLAGTLAQAHAEILGLITVGQLAGPGAPVVYTSFARGMDMRTGCVTMASPEFALLKAGMAQLGRSLDLPVRMPGMLRDAKRLDAQAGFETGMVGTVAGLSADIMDGMQLDSDLVVDYADLVFCNDAISAINRLARPVIVDAETLAEDVVAAVGPGGTFLNHEHTFRHFRQELWQSAVFERRTWDKWAMAGARDIRAVCLTRARELLGGPLGLQVDASAAAGLDAIADKARVDYGA